MTNPTVLIPDRPAGDFRPQTLVSPQSGGIQRHLRRTASVGFDRNGDRSTLELEIQNVGGSAWAFLSLDKKVVASFLVFPSPPCSETENGIGRFGLPGGDWLKDMSRAMGLAYDENQWHRDGASEILEVLFHGGIDAFQLIVRRIWRSSPPTSQSAPACSPSTPQSAPTCSYIAFLRHNDRITATHIIE